MTDPWEAVLRELVAATDAHGNELPRHKSRGEIKPASPGWAASVKRLGMAWVDARTICRGDEP